MAWQKKTTYAMLTPERRLQLLEEIGARCATRFTTGLPPDSYESSEEEQQLEPVQDEAYVKVNWRFIRQERAMTDMLFNELEAEEESEADAEEPQEPGGS